MRRTNLIISVACLAVAIGGYLLVGSPGMGDQPMADRQAASPPVLAVHTAHAKH